jgi:hypothetical protein
VSQCSQGILARYCLDSPPIGRVRQQWRARPSDTAARFPYGERRRVQRLTEPLSDSASLEGNGVAGGLLKRWPRCRIVRHV